MIANSFLGLYFSSDAYIILNGYGPRLKFLLLRCDAELERQPDTGSPCYPQRHFQPPPTAAASATNATARTLDIVQYGVRLIDMVSGGSPDASQLQQFVWKIKNEQIFQDLVLQRSLDYISLGHLPQLKNLNLHLVTYFDGQTEFVRHFPVLVRAFRKLAVDCAFPEGVLYGYCSNFESLINSWLLLVEMEAGNRKRAEHRPTCGPNPFYQSPTRVRRQSSDGQPPGFGPRSPGRQSLRVQVSQRDPHDSGPLSMTDARQGSIGLARWRPTEPSPLGPGTPQDLDHMTSQMSLSGTPRHRITPADPICHPPPRQASGSAMVSQLSRSPARPGCTATPQARGGSPDYGRNRTQGRVGEPGRGRGPSSGHRRGGTRGPRRPDQSLLEDLGGR